MCSYRIVVRVLVVYPHNCMADWKLWPTATAQHHDRVSSHVSLAWEKIKIQSLKYSFY